MTVNLLSAVDVVAISLVKKGANRKRIFLRKVDDDTELFDLPATSRIIKNADWSVFYCVVAEPGHLENPGLGAKDAETPDRWASEDEIQKAAWRFMANGALVNKMHESLEPYGDIVENAVALADFEVNGEEIKKGSWYVAIAPTDEARREVDDGELLGLSIQGSGMRTPVEKAKLSTAARNKLSSSAFVFPKDRRYPIHDISHARNALARSSGKPEEAAVKRAVYARYAELRPGKVDKTHAGDMQHRTGPLRHLIRFYMKKPHPFRACVRDNRKRFGPRTEAICAGLKDIALGTHKWRAQFKGKRGHVAKAEEVSAREQMIGTAAEGWYKAGLTDDDAKLALDAVRDADRKREEKMSKSILKAIGRAVGVDVEDLEDAEVEDLEKKPQTFATYITERKIEDELPSALDAFRSSVFRAFYPQEGEESDPRQLLAQSSDEFKEWVLELVGKLPVKKLDELAKQAQVELEEETMGWTPEEAGRVGKVEEVLVKLGEGLTTLTKSVENLVEKSEENKPPTLEELNKKFDGIGEVVADVKKGLELLAEGSSTQGSDNGSTVPVNKSDEQKQAEALLGL